MYLCVGERFSRVRTSKRLGEVGLLGLVHLGQLAGPALLPSGLFCPLHQERKVGFSGAHTLSLLFPRASCWLSPSSERRWRRSDATCGTRKSTPRSTAGSQREVSFLAPLGPSPAARPAGRVGCRGVDRVRGLGSAGMWVPCGGAVAHLPTCREASASPGAGG